MNKEMINLSWNGIANSAGDIIHESVRGDKAESVTSLNRDSLF
jgi:hypothetical protein